MELSQQSTSNICEWLRMSVRSKLKVLPYDMSKEDHFKIS